MWPLSHVRAGVGGGTWWGGDSSGAPSTARGMTAGQGGTVLKHRDNGRMSKTGMERQAKGCSGRKVLGMVKGILGDMGEQGGTRGRGVPPTRIE